MKKNILTYCLFVLISIAYCIESASYMLKALNSDSISFCLEDMDCDHEDGDCDDNFHEKEAKILYHQEYGSLQFTMLSKSNITKFLFSHNINFSSADYSRVIYSPPELA